MNPKISVVIPHWNQSHLISNALMSIKNQTFEDWECIIVDDGSDDLLRLREILLNFDDSRFKIILLEHHGLVNARNNGCEVAKGEIIVTQDADDLSMPDRLWKILEVQPFDVLYHGAYLNMWDAKFNCITRKYLPAEPLNKERLFKEQYTNGWYVFKKSVWEQKPFRYETQYAYDWAAILEWFFSGFQIKNLDAGLYEYVRHENSASIRFEKEGLRQQSIEKIKEIMLKEYGQIIDYRSDASMESGASCKECNL